jgi:hypothetical protein
MKVALASSVVCAPGAQSIVRSGLTDSFAVGNDSFPSPPAPTVIPRRRHIHDSARYESSRGEIMSLIKHGVAVAAGFMTRSVGLVSLALVVLFAQPAQAQGQLTFFKNYFITGDYVVGGASLFRKGDEGFANQDIVVSGVPEGAEILAAFLYVQSAVAPGMGPDAGIAKAKFRGFPLTSTAGASIAKALNWSSGTLACWSYGWPTPRRLVTYRADVLRFLPVDNRQFLPGVLPYTTRPNPSFGKQVANGSHRIQVPDGGRGSHSDDDEEDWESESGPRAVGASLVVVYKDANPSPTQPLRSVVIYDGAFTKRAFLSFNQTMKGFYQPTASPDARMTHIVGDGQRLLSEKLSFGAPIVTTVTNPFRGANGPRWDNTTFTNVALDSSGPGMGLTSTSVIPNGLFSDCLSWSAIVLSTNVQDTDNDGLLDVWETDSGLTDPNGQLLPDLHNMGANKDLKDVFVEIGYMRTNIGLPYGGVFKPAHSHRPTPEALKMVGDAFKGAPVDEILPSTTPKTYRGINIHFDVGNNYPSSQADPYIIRDTALVFGLARGGEVVNETACSSTAGALCQFPKYPGTVGWKTGFRFLRDELLDPTKSEDDCEQPGALGCGRRFDRSRKDMFRYAFFAHSVGLPQDPCLKADGSVDAACQKDSLNHPGFRIPRTNSGIADFPGGDMLVTLGAFDDGRDPAKPVGNDLMQAGTILHELGHTFGRRHGGDVNEPNCKPNYLSVMSYLFQFNGVKNAAGLSKVDLSGTVLDLLRKNNLDETTGLGAAPLPYRTGWYAPKSSSFLKDLNVRTATKHCDGSELTAADVPMVRIDGTNLGLAIDWNANLNAVDQGVSQDINFSGASTANTVLNAGANDWATIRLDQLGARRNVGGLFPTLDAAGRRVLGPLSLDVGRGDIGRGDIGRGDIGRGDIGRGDIGRGDIGRGDIGRGDIGRGDIGRGDIGKGDFGRGDYGVGAAGEAEGEADAETVAALGNTPPIDLQASLTEGSISPSTYFKLDWKAPVVGQVLNYKVYRVVGPTVTESNFPSAPLKIVSGSTTTTIDNPYSAFSTFTYFVIAEFTDFTVSGVSNFVTISRCSDGCSF